MSDLGDSAVTVAPQLETQQSAAEFRAHAEQDSVKAGKHGIVTSCFTRSVHISSLICKADGDASF